MRVSWTLDSFTDEVTTLIPIDTHTHTHKAYAVLHFSIHKSWLWLSLSRIFRLHTRCNENDARIKKPQSRMAVSRHHSSRLDGFASNLGAWKASHVVFFFQNLYFFFAISRGTPTMFCRTMVGGQRSRLTPERPTETKLKMICDFTCVGWQHVATHLTTTGRFP